MSDSKKYTFWDDTPDVSALEAVDLPLPRTNWLVRATVDDLAEGKRWPPKRFALRDHAVLVYDLLAEGDYEVLFSPVAPSGDDDRTVCVDRSTFRVSGDPIRSRVDAALGVVVRSQPALTRPELMPAEDLVDTARTAVVNQLKYSGGYVISGWTPDSEPYMFAASPGAVYPLADGGYMTVNYRVSDDAESYQYDLADVVVGEPSGRTVRMTFSWKGSHAGYGYVAGTYGPDGYRSGSGSNNTFGDLVDFEEWGDSWLTAVPGETMWGTSFIDRMVKTCVELAVRNGQISHVLNANAHPTLVATYEEDVLKKLSETPDYVDLESLGGQSDADMGKVETATEIEKQGRRADVMVDPFGDVSREFLTFPGDLTPGIEFVRFLLNDMLAQDTGIPGWFVSGAGVPSGISGVALDRVLHRFTAMTDWLRYRTRLGLQRAVNQLYEGDVAEVQWESSTAGGDEAGPMRAMAFMTGQVGDDT